MNYKKMFSAARLLAGLAALMGLAGSALAAGNTIAAPGLGANSAWTVYAFGNAQAVSDAFRALANFASSSTFQSIVSMIAVIGVLGVGLSGGFNPAVARKFIGYVVGVFLVSYVFFGVNNGGPLVVNVEVIDTVDMTWKAPVTVPAVVGIPASIISSAGYKITHAIEASFAIPTELKMSNGAPFNLAASMIADASQARITDPALAASLAYYVQDCFTVGVAQGTLSAATLVNSTNFLSDIQFDSKVILVNTLLQAPKGTPGLVTCTDAYTLIKNAINATGSGAADFLKDASAWSKTPAVSVINAAADSTAQWATNNGITDGGSMIKQAAVLSAFRGAYSQASAQTGNSEFLTGIAMSQATEAQRTSWITGAEIFNKTMGYIFAIIQVFVYAITPLVLCAALVPGLGLALLKNFSQILLWLAIWQPMLAIVNFIVISMQQADLGGALNNAGSYGFTLQNMGIITERTANLRAAASFVGTMVPALAWAMVKGSVDFSRVIGSAVGENFAQGAANTMATGNYSLNQASMDSFTANKHSTAATGAWGSGHTTNGAVGSQTYDLGGSQNVKVGENQAGVQVSSAESAQENGNRGRGAQVGSTGSDLQSATESFMRALSASISAGGGFGLSSSAITSNSLSGGLGANFGLIQPAGKGGPSGQVIPGTNVPMAPGANGAPGQQGDTAPASFGKPGQTRFRLDANGNLNAVASGQEAVVHNYNRNALESDTATRNNVSARVKSGGITGTDTENAAEGSGYNKSINRTIQGIPATADRAEQMAALLHMDNFMTQGKWGYGPKPTGDVANKTLAMNEQGTVPNAVEGEKKAVKETRQELAGDVAKLKGSAIEQKQDFEGDAKKTLKHNSLEARAAETPAQASASSRMVDAIGRGTGILNDAQEQLKERGIDVGKVASGEQSIADIERAQMEKLKGGDGHGAEPPKAAAQANGKPETGKPDAGKPTPLGVTSADLTAAKPGQPGSGKQTTPSTTAAKPDGSHGAKPDGKPDGKGPKGAGLPDAKPDGKGTKPGGDTPQGPGRGGMHSMKGSDTSGMPHHKQRPSPMAAIENGEAANNKPEAQGGQPDQKGGKPEARGGKPGAGKPEQTGVDKPQGAPRGGNRPEGSRQPKTTQSQRPHEQPGQDPKPATPKGAEVKGANPAQGGEPAKGGEPTHAAPKGANPKGQQTPKGNEPAARETAPQGAARGEPQASNNPKANPDEQQRLAQGQGDPRQQQQDQEREMQQRQLAAAAAMAQALAAVMPPPAPPAPQAPPPVTPTPEPQQMAMAAPQQPQPPAADNGVPNPFSGEKEAPNQQQVQGQVQLAEQRAERLENQRRNVDGVLAGAENRKPTELPELINQARDIIRSA